MSPVSDSPERHTVRRHKGVTLRWLPVSCGMPFRQYSMSPMTGTDSKALLLEPDASVKYLYYRFASHARMIDELGSGCTVKGIPISDLTGIPFLLAPLPEQIAIAAVLSDMDAEIAALETRRDKTRLLKQGMMQELLTGKTRLV